MYYAIYSSSEAGKTGCVQQFSTKLGEYVFPPMVNWSCPLCRQDHQFRLARKVLASTPKRIQNFVQYCEENNIEMDVDIS